MPPPAITPSQKDASFSMQDPSMAAAGSEGTVTYHVVVPSTNEEGDNSTTALIDADNLNSNKVLLTK
jgi:hypothetical protein